MLKLEIFCLTLLLTNVRGQQGAISVPSNQQASLSGGQGVQPMQQEYGTGGQGAQPISQGPATGGQGTQQTGGQAVLHTGDYLWGNWDRYSPCSATCGVGQRTRHRICYMQKTTSSNGNMNKLLPLMLFSGGSGSSGGLSNILKLSLISGNGGLLGNGQANGRTSVMPQEQGSGCFGPYRSTIVCSPPACPAPPTQPPVVIPVNCYTAWGPYGECSALCGDAVKIRVRQCNCRNRITGRPTCTEPLWESSPCAGLPPCVPITIPPSIVSTTESPLPAFGTWSNWSGCSNVPCGVPSKETRERTCASAGNCDGSFREIRACLVIPCPTAPTWSAWGPYSACKQTCGPASKMRFRTCTVAGQCSGDEVEITSCNNLPCPTLLPPPTWSDWGPYGACVQTCGPSTKSRFRTCSVVSQCFGNTFETTECNNPPCTTLPPLPMWNNWSNYGSCFATCGPAEKSRFRSCSVIGKCLGESIEFKPCENAPCTTLPPAPTWSDWGPYGACIQTCGPSTKSRFRTCSVASQCFGNAFETADCNNPPCTTLPPLPTWNSWSNYGGCSATCGPTEKSRVRSCSVIGKCLGKSFEFMPCENEPCPTLPPDPVWSEWGPYGACSQTCGPSTKSRFRTCSVAGQCFGNAFETMECNNTPCPTLPPLVAWGEWSAYGDCTATCGPADRSRFRSCSVAGQCPGVSIEFAACQNAPCPMLPPVSVFWSEWGKYTSCTTTCGAGTRTRVRFCIGDGECEGLSSETSICADVPCPTSTPPPVTQSEFGSWTEYGRWGDCQRNVGEDGCSQTRYRACVGGFRCDGFSFDIRECSTGPCAVVVTPPPTSQPSTNPNQPFCDASLPERRRDCGYPGISREDCWGKGCCYRDSVFGVNWCFFDDFSGPPAAPRLILENVSDNESAPPSAGESEGTQGESLDRA